GMGSSSESSGSANCNRKLWKKLRRIESKLKRRDRARRHRRSHDRASSSDSQLSRPSASVARSRTPLVRSRVQRPSRENDPTEREDVLSIQGDVDLSADVLKILGADPTKENNSTVTLHSTIADIWTNILCKGVTSEENTQLLDKYKIPSNCDRLAAPMINPELSAIMSAAYATRDNSHAGFQTLLGKGLSPIGQALTYLLDDTNIPNTSKSILLGLLKKNPPTEYLFGSNLADQIKQAKTLETAGKENTKAPPTSFRVKPATPGPPPEGGEASQGRTLEEYKGAEIHSPETLTQEQFADATLSIMEISNNLKPDFLWWENNIATTYNDIKKRLLFLRNIYGCILDWMGASSNGEGTHGWWTEQENTNHINYLELQAIYLGLQCFAKDAKNCNILIRADNTTAVSYINRMGSVRFLNLANLARAIWQWCEARNIWLVASYIQSQHNKDADTESRILPRETEWSLSMDSKLAIPNMVPPLKTTPSCELSFPGGVDCIRKLSSDKVLPQETLNTIVSSLSPTTIKQYTTTYKLWWSFCSMRGIEPYSGTIQEVLQFLQTQLEKGNNKYGYFNSHRSALSLILPGSIGEDVLMKRFMRGLSKIRPSSPKYQVTWDPLPVLRYLEQIPSSSLNELAKKRSNIIRFGNSSTPANDIFNKNIEHNKIRSRPKIFIPDRIKTSGINKPQPVLTIPYFMENKALCLANTIESYLNLTQDHRGNEDSLFLTTKKSSSRRL
ncbi:hypothetical protein NQ317_003543, partial [Molorchus minor]